MNLDSNAEVHTVERQTASEMVAGYDQVKFHKHVASTPRLGWQGVVWFSFGVAEL